MRTYEIVMRGHPDKIADEIAENLINTLPQGERGAYEVMVKGNTVYVVGEHSIERSENDLKKAVHTAWRATQNTNCEYEFNIGLQSKDISDMVAQKERGCGDNGIVYGGYDCGASWIISNIKKYADDVYNRICVLNHSDRETALDYEPYFIGHDGKAIFMISDDAVIIYHNHHCKKAVEKRLERELTNIAKSIFYVPVVVVKLNANGAFEIGGTEGDAGCTNRKIACDTYLGEFRNGGGGLFGKDNTKADKSMAIALREIAISAVGSEARIQKIELKTAFIIGDKSVNIKVSDLELTEAYQESIEEREHLKKHIKERIEKAYTGVSFEAIIAEAQKHPLKWYGL